ncbi:MAG: hypothetical protein WCD86_05385 [Ktedonobacteraceae bacterium]
MQDSVMMKELTDELKAWVRVHHLEERTIAFFWDYVEGYRNAEPQEFAEVFPEFVREAIALKIVCVDYCTSYLQGKSDFVVARIQIEHRQQRVGWLDVVYTLSGEYLTDTCYFE